MTERSGEDRTNTLGVHAKTHHGGVLLRHGQRKVDVLVLMLELHLFPHKITGCPLLQLLLQSLIAQLQLFELAGFRALCEARRA